MATITNSTTLITRYVCRHCASPMAYATTPAGELAYECTNANCQFVVMVGCECAMDEAPIAPRTAAADRARDKAASLLSQGLTVVAMDSTYLVASASRPALVHRVHNGQCSCEAARYGRTCWHVAAIALSQRAA